MSLPLHPNAALRVLRREMVRLNDARAELITALEDPRIPGGLCIQQIQQCDAEVAELTAAHRLIETAWDEVVRADARTTAEAA